MKIKNEISVIDLKKYPFSTFYNYNLSELKYIVPWVQYDLKESKGTVYKSQTGGPNYKLYEKRNWDELFYNNSSFL